MRDDKMVIQIRLLGAAAILGRRRQRKLNQKGNNSPFVKSIAYDYSFVANVFRQTQLRRMCFEDNSANYRSHHVRRIKALK